MDLDLLSRLTSQVAQALHAAHVAGIVHRDIKPANIMITRSQDAKVLDFGIAKVARGNLDTQLTSAGQIIGTAAYMSPEQTRGEDVDFRSDIFSLGCVLYEAATGQPPFQASSVLGLMHAIATVDPPDPSIHRPELRPDFVRLVMLCLTKDRSLRLDSAAELATDLRAMQFSGQPANRPAFSRTTVGVLPLKVRGKATDQ